jgi:stress responsive alpha/beta barrel protein
MAIRSVVAIRFKPGTRPERIRALIEAMTAFHSEGMLSLRCGTDVGLKHGSWDYALTADFEDREAFACYDRAAGARPDPARDRG